MTHYLEEDNWSIICPNCQDDFDEDHPLVKVTDISAGLLQRRVVMFGVCTSCGHSLACPYIFDDDVEDEQDLFPNANN